MQSLKQLLDELQIPVAYHHFNTDINPPFICYYRTSTDNYGADNKVLQKFDNYYIELYTEYKNPSVEKQLEDLLDGNEIFYDVLSEDYIDTEKMYQVIYQITLKNDNEDISI